MGCQPRTTFRLEANFTIAEPAIIGMMGPNGSGKITLFDLITGSLSFGHPLVSEEG